MLLIALLLSLLDPLNALNACLLPSLDPGRQIVCDQIFSFNEVSKQFNIPNLVSTALPFQIGGPGITMADAISGALPSDRWQCLSIECTCGFIQGAQYDGSRCNLPDGNVMGQVQRREFRTLSAAERALYRQAFLAVQGTMYRQLGIIHSNFNQSPGAHSGPNFLGWHREFLKRLELAMRTTPVTVGGQTTYPYANVFIPYWNSAFDNELIRTHGISPLNSVMFSPYLIGSVRSGSVTDGIFGNFVGSLGRVTRRALDQWNGQVTLFSFSEVADIINNHGVNDLLGATAGGSGCPNVLVDNIELVHGDVHVWIGADMQQITTSTNDPIFFLHHSFIDSIWEQWRQLRQTRSQRETQWNTGPTSCYSSAHQFNAAMVPFTGLTNRVGLSNAYTDYLYNYAPSPSCAGGCNSAFLWCDTTRNVCVARIRPGSACSRFNNIDPCYGTCSSGRCVAPANPQADDPSVTGPPHYPPNEPPKDEGCVNLHECCGSWALKGDCASNPEVMDTICPASCAQCQPAYNVVDNCENRHSLCQKYASMGKCQSNQHWMAENCRMQCGLCNQTRRETCEGQMKPLQYAKLANDAAPSGQRPSPSPPPSTTSKTCLNSHTCCSYWASQGKCDSVSDIMEKVCKASCTCQPSYNTGACDDFIKGCMNMERLGLCTVDYFAENCRKTCNKCPSSSDDADCEASMDNMSTYDNNTGSAPSHPSPPVYEKVPEVEESGYN
ncbi:hypothetical protein RB195_009095 [Necator americanus]|uniref:ShKT domain-containing protein n=1 Tax=Necator americanus TaxID=51031 RepID=A0ABR1CRR1_NECAM